MAVDKTAEKKQLNLKTLTFGDLTWVDITQPTKEVIKYLTDQYGFHPLDIEDALSPRQLPKIEDYPKYLFVIFHLSSFDKQTRVSSRKQWTAFVGEKFLVTMHPPELKAADELFHDCELGEDARAQYMSQGSGYLLYQILDRAVDSYFRVLDKILVSMEDIEDSVFEEEVEAARELSLLRRDIITQRRVMFPMRTLLTDLEKKMKRFAKPDLALYFSDLMDHVNKICETLDEYTEVIDVFKDADYLLSGYRANRTIRTLALLLALGLPFLVVAGIYVMLPGGPDKGSVQTFLLMLVAIAVLVAAILLFLRRRRLF
jgi:magnesium transporter